MRQVYVLGSCQKVVARQKGVHRPFARRAWRTLHKTGRRLAPLIWQEEPSNVIQPPLSTYFLVRYGAPRGNHGRNSVISSMRLQQPGSRWSPNGVHLQNAVSRVSPCSEGLQDQAPCQGYGRGVASACSWICQHTGNLEPNMETLVVQ